MTDPDAFDDDSDADVRHLLRMAGPRPEPPADVTARVHAQALAAWRKDCSARRRRRWLAVAACGLVAVAGVSLVPTAAPPTPAPVAPVALVLERVTGGGLAAPLPSAGQGLPVGAWIETAPDGLAAWRLQGASVRMDGATRLRLVSASSLWLERGALYVDGESGAAPLEVRTAHGRVIEIGTQFEVRAAGTRLLVRVREGRVALLRGGARREVAAGWGVEADAGTLIESAVAVHGPGWSWVEDVAPEFAIEGRSLESLVAWTARETGWSVRFTRAADAERAAAITLHGSSAGLGPRGALAAVLPACGFAFKREGAVVWIEPAERVR